MSKVKRNHIISLVFNISIFIMMVVTLVFLYMRRSDGFLKTDFSMFKFFTTDSNILMGLISLILIPFNISSIKREQEKTPLFATILNLVGTTSVALTFLTVVCFLAPLEIGKEGYFSAFTGTNFCFHFLEPIFAIISFIFFTNKNRLRFYHSFYGIIPMVLYGIYYVTNLVVHIDNGQIDSTYDFYHFAFNGKITSIYIVLPLMLFVTWLISYLLFIGYYFNRRRTFKATVKYELL